MQNQLNYLQALITKHFGTRDERGASAVEYGLLIGFIALAVIVVLVTLGPQIQDMFQGVSDNIKNNPTGGASTGS